MSMTSEHQRESKGLRAGAIGLVGSVVVGIASTAPAYSLAASLGYVVIVQNGSGIVGVKAPLIMVVAFLPMYFIAVAYSELNKAEPDCGTTFTWAARAFGTRTGWLGGWGIIAADVIVMANLSQIAGSYTFSLFGLDTLAASTFWSTVAGIVWIVVMTYICYRGIEVSVRLQYALLGVEVATLVAFALFALVKVYSGDAPGSITPSLAWLSPSGLSLTAIVSATLIAVFIYWGWDTAVATNEECHDPATTPGRAAVISTVLLLLTYALVSVATIAFAGVGTTGIGLGNVNNADDVFAAMGHDVFGGGVVGWIMVHLLAICVLTSASASTQTTILPTARTSLSMAAFKAIPERFARIHPTYLTPSDSTIWMGGVSIVFYVGLTLLSANILADTIAAVGLLIAFYYGLTGFACAWFYRRTMWRKPRDVLMQGVLPLLGGVLLLAFFLIAAKTYADPSYGYTSIAGVGGVFLIGIGSLLLGVVLMFVYQAVSPAYFRGDTLPKAHSADLVLVGGGGRPEGCGCRTPRSAP
ncbi:APC family permease [Nocardioides panacis]|uniref:APC family permease n=1 Tax=Nocardioides panacis TaxID=2849501 RepID=A0A975T0E4_9ACTN|nr:APC family permease [Nocardioides panacis]QWZ08745.1 APC family permease [Nocardioides panacis]